MKRSTRKPYKSDITVRGYVLYESGPVPVEELTEEQRETWQAHMCSRLSEAMSDYYTQHPDQWERLCRSLDSQERAAAAGP